MKFVLFLPALLAGMLTVNASQAAENVHFSGALVAEPCTLPDADTDIHVDFGTIVVKYLYQYQRTKGQSFTLHLEDCDPSVMKTVGVTFKGQADDELTEMLALDPSSSAKGVAVGFSMPDGSSLAVNKISPITQLSQGKNNLEFFAYVQARPTAVTAKTLAVGDFSAISTFVLTYQ